MKTTIKVALSLLATVLLVAWVSAHDNDHDFDHDGDGDGGGLRGLLDVFSGGGADPIWDIFTNGRPARWVPVPGNPRFAVHPAGAAANQQVVLDRSTGLVWEKVLSTTLTVWEQAFDNCNTSRLGNVMGWRLPGLQELQSLVDPANANPALPTGHPFVGTFTTNPVLYWSATTDQSNAGNALGVAFDNAQIAADSKVISHRYWCVRGGQGLDNQ